MSTSSKYSFVKTITQEHLSEVNEEASENEYYTEPSKDKIIWFDHEGVMFINPSRVNKIKTQLD